ncbi:MAG TPA: o-succinylbenzoate--CoA ligase [Microlunatus sp.]|nr:o-succinylbenzoate--CoA ligase [Microlunatus sp.]
MIEPAELRAAYASGDTIRLPTSGTTGRPRWVERTAASWVDSFEVVARLCALSAASRVWVPGPVAASMNAYALCLADHVGARVAAASAEASHGFCTPAALDALLERDAPPLTLVVAGDRLSAAAADRAEAAGHTVHHYYGAAQLSFVAWGRDGETLRLFPGVRAEGWDGVLWVSSPWLCQREEGPSPVLRRQVRGGRLWMSVGDRGSVDGDGCLTVAGRLDTVTTGGATVVLADVEAALRPYADGEIVVVGRPHRTLGSVLVAACTDPGDVERLPAVARRELPASHRPRAWSLLDAVPLTSSGKIDRSRIAG